MTCDHDWVFGDQTVWYLRNARRAQAWYSAPARLCAAVTLSVLCDVTHSRSTAHLPVLRLLFTISGMLKGHDGGKCLIPTIDYRAGSTMFDMTENKLFF